MAQIDPAIEALFGPLRDGLDLGASTEPGYDVFTCVVLGLAAASVALRYYIRIRHNGQAKRLGSDDYTIVLGLVCTGALVATTLVARGYGSGSHVWSTNIKRLMDLLKIVFVEPWIYAASVTSTKVSILLLYRRLFYRAESGLVASDHLFTIMFWTATFLTGTYPIIMWTVMACSCRPISFYWEQYEGATDGSCIDILQFFLVFGIINMVNDIMILAVPIPRIMKLHMNKQKKASIAGIMLLGGFVCVASIVRIYYLRRLSQEIDVTWNLGPAFAWSALEPSIAIISACLPTFAPLFRGLRTKGGGSSSNAKNRAGSSGYPSSGHIRLQEYTKHTPGHPEAGHSSFRIEEDELYLTGKDSFGQVSDSDSADKRKPESSIAVRTEIDVVRSIETC